MSFSKSTQKILDQGFAFLGKAEFELAHKQFQQVLQHDPRNFDALHMLGVIALQTRNWESALDYFDKAIAINPRFADAHSNRSAALHEIGRFEESLASADHAIALEPHHAGAHCNRGVALRSLKRMDEALMSCERAIQLDPEGAFPHFNRSLFFLLSGNFAQGWEAFEWRWKTPSFHNKRYPFHQPQWLGHQSLRGKTILLQAEQGFGDTLQMCRYVPKVQALGARIVMDVPLPLQPLLMQMTGVAQWVKPGETFPDFDYYCHLMSLPLAFETRLETIPATVPYLKADAAKVAHWSAQLGEKKCKRVGLVWSGSTTHLNDHNRSLELQNWLQHLPAGFDYVCLQKELRDVDRRILQESSAQGLPTIRYWGDAITDFTDTAALCELMDVVISVDTSVAHLAGALGKKLWVLLPFVPDWRWLLDRTDSPWYPTATLYRQPQPNDWNTVLQHVADDLTRLPELTEVPSARPSWLQRLRKWI